MSVAFELPPEVERILRGQFQNFDQAAKEAALIELYRQNKLTHHQLSLALGLSRFETDGVLKQHNVFEDLLTPDEIQDDLKKLRELPDK